jgi:hypothetical protein
MNILRLILRLVIVALCGVTIFQNCSSAGWSQLLHGEFHPFLVYSLCMLGLIIAGAALCGKYPGWRWLSVWISVLASFGIVFQGTRYAVPFYLNLHFIRLIPTPEGPVGVVVGLHFLIIAAVMTMLGGRASTTVADENSA